MRCLTAHGSAPRLSPSRKFEMKRTQDDRQATSTIRRRALAAGGSLAVSPARFAYLLAWLLVALDCSARLSAADVARIARGQELYVRNCFACHQLDGAGVPGTFPPLADAVVLLLILVILYFLLRR